MNLTVVAEGFEPSTCELVVRCSVRMSYATVKTDGHGETRTRNPGL